MDPSYNNSFDSFGANSGQFQSGSVVSDGDISMAATKPVKKKKGLAIGIVVLLVIVAVIAVAFVLSNKRTTEKYDTEMSYMGLVLTGEEDFSGLEGSFDSDNVYHFEKMYYDDENNDLWEGYYSTISERLDKLISETEDGLKKNELIKQKKVLLSLAFDKKMGDRMEYLMDLYIQKGYYESDRELKSTMNSFTEQSLDIHETDDYNTFLNLLFQGAQEMVGYYESFGCNIVSASEINCDDVEVDPSNLGENITMVDVLAISNTDAAMDDLVTANVNSFVSSVFSLKYHNGETANEE